MIGSASAQTGTAKRAQLPAIKRGTNTSFGPLKQIDAGVLNVGYVEAGPANGPPVILLHGWPYDIHSFVDVVPMLAAAGDRLIVPYLRGYGATRFLSRETINRFSDVTPSRVATSPDRDSESRGAPGANGTCRRIAVNRPCGILAA